MVTAGVIRSGSSPAAVIAISWVRSASRAAMVRLPGTISIAWTAPEAPETGASTLPPTATAMTAMTAMTAAGKTMPRRRNGPRLRRPRRAPVRCCDKAVPSFGPAGWENPSWMTRASRPLVHAVTARRLPWFPA